MANIIIVLILVALVGYGIYSYVHHLTHGGGAGTMLQPYTLLVVRSGR